ncbi:MAG: hypothetical protein ACE5KJ_03820, partial [Candidatus Zixiibacteriota bacterium]
YWRIFYPDGKKIVPKAIKQYLNPLALAVWIMDDGSYNYRRIDISTYSFTLKEIQRLQEAMRERFNLVFKYFRDRDKGYRIYFSIKETNKAVELIRSHIIPSVFYKIGVSSITP